MSRMLRPAAARLAQAVPLLLMVSVADFAVMHAAPGGPTTMYLRSPLSSDAQVGAMRRAMSLTDPLPLQYVHWLTSLLRGSWGYSYADGRPVLVVILERVPATLLLTTTALGIALAVALPIGIVSAVRHSSWVDHALAIGSLVAWAMPAFWLGIVAQELLAVDVPLLPVAGLHTTGVADPLDLLHHLVLPALVLSAASVAGWSRYLRSSLLEVLTQPYITTARAKGGSRQRALLKHALPNALLPLVTIIGLDIPRLFAGAVVTETVFAWPGMGRLFFDSLESRDYPVELGVLMITAALIVFGNLVADLLCAALDPRIRPGAAVR